MRKRGWPWRGFALALALAAATGCGDDGAGAEQPRGQETAAGARMPSPAVSAEETATRLLETLEAARKRSDCRFVRAVGRRSSQRFACPMPFGPRIRNFRAVDSQTYGTAAVIDYTTRRSRAGAAMVMFVDPDRSWGVGRFGLLVDEHPSVATSDEDSRSGFAKAVEGYLTAVRERDCAAFRTHAVTGGDPRLSCRREFPRTRDLARRLSANPGAQATYLGGNAIFGVHGILTSEPTPAYETIVTVPRRDAPALCRPRRGAGTAAGRERPLAMRGIGALLAIASVGAAAILPGCAGTAAETGGTTPPPKATVVIADDSYRPATLRVAPGTRVTWINRNVRDGRDGRRRLLRVRPRADGGRRQIRSAYAQRRRGRVAGLPPTRNLRLPLLLPSRRHERHGGGRSGQRAMRIPLIARTTCPSSCEAGKDLTA